MLWKLFLQSSTAEQLQTSGEAVNIFAKGSLMGDLSTIEHNVLAAAQAAERVHSPIACVYYDRKL